MQTTQYYGLKKPEDNDVTIPDNFNDNMDIIDGVLKKLATRRVLTLTAAGWSGTYPFTQTVTVSGILADDDMKVIGVYIPADATLGEVKAWNKAAGYLICNPDGVADGKITFRAYKKPVVDVRIITEGG